MTDHDAANQLAQKAQAAIGHPVTYNNGGIMDKAVSPGPNDYNDKNAEFATKVLELDKSDYKDRMPKGGHPGDPSKTVQGI